MSKILIEDLRIYAYHGCLPEENSVGTYYLINMEIRADLWKASETDHLDDTLNYVVINDIIHEEMKIQSHLLEHVSGRIIRRIETEIREVELVKIKISKLNPPLQGEMKAVSVEFEKNLIKKEM